MVIGQNLLFMIGWYLFYSLLAVALGYTNILGGDDLHFYLLSGLLCIFIVLELWQLYKTEKTHFFISPILLSCIVTFGMSLGGISNFLQMKDGQFYFLEVGSKVLPHEKEWMRITMAQVCIGAMFTWIGYKGKWGFKLSHLILERIKMGQFLGSNFSMPRLALLIIFGYGIKLYLFSIGLYGRIVDPKFFAPVSGYKMGSQIRIFTDFSLLTFIFVCYLFFSNKSKRITLLFFACFTIELFFAFLYGARGPFLVPFLVIFVTGYFVTQRINLINIILIPTALLLAFTVVLEFKNYALSKEFRRHPNPITVLNNFLRYRETRPSVLTDDIYNNKYENIKASTNAVANAAMAIRHMDTYGLDENDPNFVQNIVLSPYNAFVPKFLQSKNEFAWGYWFKNKVLKHAIALKYSISITPVGFLYFAGGTLGVCIGFFIYGILLRFTFTFLNYGILGFLMFLTLLSTLYNFDSVFSGTLVSVIRFTFLYPIIYYFTFASYRRR